MFRPVQSKRLHQQVFEQIQEMLLSGRLKPGDKLPSERDLVELLKVSRNSIREALRSLEVLGIIECRQGGGNYIKLDVGAGLLEPMSIMFHLRGGKFTDILEVRRSLEASAVALAAERATPEQGRALMSLIESLKADPSEAGSVRIDKELHFKIAELSGNALLMSFLSAISSLLESSIKRGRVGIMRSIGNKAKLLEAHERICKAIVAGDREAAVSASDAHFKMILDNLAEK